MLWSLGQKKSVEYDNHGNQGIFMGTLYRCKMFQVSYTVSFSVVHPLVAMMLGENGRCEEPQCQVMKALGRSGSRGGIPR